MIGLRKTLLTTQVKAPYSIFTDQIPFDPDVSDSVPYELGLKFQSTVSGWILGVRHYKSALETGSHTGRLWAANGTLLASVNFENETALGWQSQFLLTPLPINANTTYAVSVNSSLYFSLTQNAFDNPLVNKNLVAVADNNNGFYNVTPGLFPNTSFNNSNYFRDIIFLEGT
jgi:Domain of unknown function (DUF4082)